MVRAETTPNVLRSQEKKKRLREERKIADTAEAEKLGISIFQLKANRYKEVVEIRKNPPEVSFSMSMYRY